MKKVLFFALLHMFLPIVCFSQNIVSDIQTCFEELKTNIQLKLDSCRTNPDIGDFRYGLLKTKLINFLAYNKKSSSYGKTRHDLEKELDALNPQLHWQMIYDDSMIERMIQLLNNKYRKDEFDTLINRRWQRIEKKDWKRIVMYTMKADTLKIFKYIKDSLNVHRNKNIHKDIYQDDEVFQYLRLDTTSRFRFVKDSLMQAEHERVVNDYLNSYHFEIGNLIRTCGYVNDKRFVEPLIDLLNKIKRRAEEITKVLEEKESYDLENEKNLNEKIIPVIKNTLVRMKVEPYRTDLLKELTQPLDTVKKQDFTGKPDYLSIFADNPDYLLELSKYLHSDANTMITSEGFDGTAYEDAYITIKKYIKNKSLWDIINQPDFDLEKDRFTIYDWMQKNYGKYEIKRLW
jgi:hypothetical protein